MTRAEVLSLSLKLAAVYLWIHGLIFASNLGFFVHQINEPGQTAVFALSGVVVPTILLFLLGALLFHLAPTFAARMTGGSATADFEDRGEVGAIGLRIAAVLLWLRAIKMTSSAVFQIRVARIDGRWAQFLTEVATIVVLAAIGAWLFLRAEAIARRRFGRPAVERRPGAATTLQAVAFSVAGLWVLADVVPELIRLGVAAVERSRSDAFGELSPLRIGQDWTKTLEQILRAVFGVVLFLGGKGLSALWHRVREAGLFIQRAGVESNGKSN